MIRGLLKTTALAVVAGGLVLAGRGLSQADNAAGTQYYAELVNKITPPPPPPHTDPNVVDLSDKKGPLIPRIPGSACGNQNAAQMLALLPPGAIEPGPCPYPFPVPPAVPLPRPAAAPLPGADADAAAAAAAFIGRRAAFQCQRRKRSTNPHADISCQSAWDAECVKGRHSDKPADCGGLFLWGWR